MIYFVSSGTWNLNSVNQCKPRGWSYLENDHQYRDAGNGVECLVPLDAWYCLPRLPRGCLSQIPFIRQCEHSTLVIPLDWEEMSCHPVYTAKFLALSDGKVYVPSLMVLVVWTKLKHAPPYPLQDFKALYKCCIIIIMSLCFTNVLGFVKVVTH